MNSIVKRIISKNSVDILINKFDQKKTQKIIEYCRNTQGIGIEEAMLKPHILFDVLIPFEGKDEAKDIVEYISSQQIPFTDLIALDSEKYVVVENNILQERILETYGNQITRSMLQILSKPQTSIEVADKTNISLGTVYRHIQNLQKYGLVISHGRIPTDKQGRNSMKFSTWFDARIDVVDGEFLIRIKLQKHESF